MSLVEVKKNPETREYPDETKGEVLEEISRSTKNRSV